MSKKTTKSTTKKKAKKTKKAEAAVPDMPITVNRSVLELHWKLTHTREWPISMMSDLAYVKDAYQRAIVAAEKEAGVGEGESSSTDKASA